MKIGTAVGAVLLLLVPLLVVVAAARAVFGGSAAPSTAALGDIPADRLALYRQAATVCPGLDWSILAAIGKIESDHGRSTLPGVTSGANHAGAGGPMQFLQPTFDSVTARHRLPPGGATPPSRYNPQDAVYAAAHYLCDSGVARGDLRGAIFTYNRSETYVDNVLSQAARYAATPTDGAGCAPAAAASRPALVAIAFACAQLGQPYVWGGDGGVEGGFDCSGLTAAAFGAAGIALPRTADTQYRSQPPVPDGQPLLPGDLLFYGSTSRVTHVALYLGNSQIINAPTFGQPVRVQPARYQGDRYVGAARPAPWP